MKYKGKIYRVLGNQGSTNQVTLEGKKYPNIKFVTLYRFGKGFNVQ